MNSLLLALIVAAATPDFTVEELDAHPRPDWAHACQLLDGQWQFDFDPNDAGVNEKWFENHAFSKSIRVPFPWQSPLSGINDVAYQGVAWYQREIAVPKSVTNRRVFLVFGAVDWQATVWLDGKQVAEHEGGYSPFEVEITDLVKPGKKALLTVRAFDITDPETPTGKQTGWYTPSGGIWQSVYLEYRGRTYLKKARIVPDIDNNKATFDCEIECALPGNYTVALQSTNGRDRLQKKQSVECKTGLNKVQLVLPVPNATLWSPDSPILYETKLSLLRGTTAEDTVQTYFGMRKVSRGTYGGSPFEYILLNNKPIYLRGALHQSFNPEGLYTHPSDAFIRNDYVKAKEFGLNFIRIHIKVEEPRALYWADRLGVLLMCDMPNFAKNTPRSHALWEQMLRDTIDRDFNHPSIFAWCDFNETWGIQDGGYTREVQEWVRDMYLLTKELDPTRLAEDNSPCHFDHVLTDINSWHFYIDDYQKAATHIADVVEKTSPGSTFNYAEGWKQDTAPLINSEYGGVSAGGGDRDIGWVFAFLTNLLRKYDKIGGYVYTELEDIEWEHNGFMNYDRSPKEFPYPAGITLAELQSPDFPVLDCPPLQTVLPGAAVKVPVLLSHWSEREGLKVRVSVVGKTVEGIPWSKVIKPVEWDVQAVPYRVSPVQTFEFTLPPARGLVNVVAEVLCDGQRVGANYCVVDVRPEDKGRKAFLWNVKDEYAAMFSVGAFTKHGFENEPQVAPNKGKVSGFKAGYFEYALKLPYRLKPENVTSCRLTFEAASRAETERLDWPAKRNKLDYPQTDGKAWPTDLTVSINGVPVHTATLKNDYADAAGVLSHAAEYQHGSRGEYFEVPLEGPALEAVRNAIGPGKTLVLRFEVKADAQNVGGLSLYGNNMGSYAGDPALVFGLTPDSDYPTSKPRVLKGRTVTRP